MIQGYVERIIYKNNENAYCVIEVSSGGDTSVLVGTFPYIEEGNFIEAEGDVKLHPVYGEQIVVTKYRLTEPGDIKSTEKYLSSGAIKGIGQALAARIVKRFGDDTLRIMEEEPERLAEIKGISERMAMEISAQVEEKKDMRDAMMYLTKYGISMNLALKIYRLYGEELYSIIEENPYRIAEDIEGVGFKIADEIARKVGITYDSEYRIRSGILYVLSQAMAAGHMYLPKEMLLEETRNLLGEDVPVGGEDLINLQMEKKVFIKNFEDECCEAVYSAVAYYTELSVAGKLCEIDDCVKIEIITGGPGTGKTTNIKKFIAEYEKEGLEVKLAAPTGRAAKRMTEATGHEASTIHRLLEVSGISESFERNEDNPIEADVIIIDEMSMVDIFIMNALLKAVTPGMKLILVGDINQLPSVGPGNVLRDIIDSGRFNVKRLNKIYRQDEESDIVINAHKMIDEEEIDLAKRSKDFLFIKRDNPEKIIAAMLTLIKEKLPSYVNAKMTDIQIMSPMKKGALGVERLNTILQNELNPKSIDKAEKEINGCLWREGDKVMQIKNNYEKNVYNGDIGVITEINNFGEILNILFDDGREIEYNFSEMEEIELAYAITIHKSQGSEYSAVVIPCHQFPKMLMTRNLIYTAVTRARDCVCLVGLPENFFEMTGNTKEMERYSGLNFILSDSIA